MRFKMLFLKVFDMLAAMVNYTLVRIYVSFVPLKEEKYFCISMLGNNYGDNIKCLSDYITHNNPHSTIIWAFTKLYYHKTECAFPKVKLFTIRYYYHILTSKYILNNATLGVEYLVKRKGQVVLETWHGTCLKRIGSDILESEKRNIFSRLIGYNRIKYNASMIDIFISGSKFMTDIYQKKFYYKGKVYETGTPRNDIFFQDLPEIVKKIKNCYKIDERKGIILYAPTFRQDGRFDYYDVDLATIRQCCEKRYGKEFAILVRLHPNLLSKQGMFSKMFPSDAIDVSFYPDMRELLYCTDIYITDYSSAMFDFMYLKRPIIMYVPDRKTYNRGYYLDIDSLPAIIINNNTEINDKIDAYVDADGIKAMDRFLQDIGSVEDGHATRNIINLLNMYK